MQDFSNALSRRFGFLLCEFLDPRNPAALAEICGEICCEVAGVVDDGGAFIGIAAGTGVPFDFVPSPYAVSTVRNAIWSDCMFTESASNKNMFPANI